MKLPDIMNYTREYILGTDEGVPLAYLGKDQVLSLFSTRADSLQLMESLSPAMELIDGDLKVPIYLWRDVYALMVKEGLETNKSLITNPDWVNNS